MVRIIAALSLAALLGASAVPAVAQNLDEGRLFFGEDGDLAISGEAEDLEGFFVGEFEDLEDLFDAGLLFIGGGDEEEDLVGSSVGSSVVQGFEQEDVESGDVEPSVNISNSGDNVNGCYTVLQSANSGNVQNAQGVVQYQSEADDIEFEGSSITIAPEAAGSCDQTIRQTAAAGR